MRKIIIVLILIISIVLCLYFIKTINPTPINKQDAGTFAAKGSALLFGQITSLHLEGGKVDANVQLMEDVQGQDNQEQAALEDSTCSLEQIENDQCLNNPFYLRK